MPAAATTSGHRRSAAGAKHFTRAQVETDLVQGRHAPSGWAGTDLFETDLALGRRQFHLLDLRGKLAQQVIQALIGQLGRTPLLPHCNQLVDGAEHPAHEDRAGDHHPGSHIASDHQQGA